MIVAAYNTITTRHEDNYMQKSKRKGRPGSRRIVIGVLTVVLLLIACGFWFWLYVIIPNSLNEFRRFESSEEVVAFLHDHFDLHVTTSDDIRTFMDAYPLEYDGCEDSTPYPGDFEGFVVNTDVTNIINCSVRAGGSIAGAEYYLLRFYMDKDDLLVYISARWVCACI
jgi:hypothetical protein